MKIKNKKIIIQPNQQKPNMQHSERKSTIEKIYFKMNEKCSKSFKLKYEYEYIKTYFFYFIW